MTATQTPCLPDADRFYRTASVPAPPETAPRRRLYWDDSVTEAIGELRRRLRSSREEMVTQALFAILDLEKHKLRHGRPISGTHVPYLGELDDSPERRPILPNRAEPPSPNVGTETPQQHGPIRENQATSPATTTAPVVTGRKAGATIPPPPPIPPPPAPDFSHLTPVERDFAERDAEIDAGVRRIAAQVFLPLLDDFARAARPVRARRPRTHAARHLGRQLGRQPTG